MLKVEKRNLRSGELLKAHWQLKARRLTHRNASQSVELEHVWAGSCKPLREAAGSSYLRRRQCSAHTLRPVCPREAQFDKIMNRTACIFCVVSFCISQPSNFSKQRAGWLSWWMGVEKEAVYLHDNIKKWISIESGYISAPVKVPYLTAGA